MLNQKKWVNFDSSLLKIFFEKLFLRLTIAGYVLGCKDHSTADNCVVEEGRVGSEGRRGGSEGSEGVEGSNSQGTEQHRQGRAVVHGVWKCCLYCISFRPEGEGFRVG